jgi:diguanylate cyclase (GGDEF)-like protein/PAS domain S-box-containing protein
MSADPIGPLSASAAPAPAPLAAPIVSATHAQLLALTENVPVSLACFAVKDQRFIHANARFARLTGRDQAVLVGMPLIAIVGEEIAQATAPHIQRMIAERCPIKFEYCLLRVDRPGLWFDVHLVPENDADGNVSLCYVSMSNITSHWDATQLAHQAAERLRKFMEASTEGMVFHDGGKIVDVNPPLLRILDYTSDEVIGQSPLKFIAPEAQAEATAAISVSREATYDSVLIRRDGSRVPVQFATRNLLWNGSTVRMSIVRDMTERMADAARIHFLAMHDSLTGLANRAQLNERLALLLEGAAAADARLAVLFIDVDHFKRINDSLGHAAGDEVLVTFADRLKAACGDSALLSRLGGDEFIVVQKQSLGREHTAAFGQRALAALAEPLSIQGRRMSVTASIGVALFPDDGNNNHTLLKNADAAMYLAKAQGRATLRFFDASLARAADQALTIETQLTAAIGNREFELFYQPQVREPDGALIGVEALIRWRHPELGLVGPNQFIAVAEGLQLIMPIGQWVLDEALAQVSKWRAAGWARPRVAVNLSSVQFRAANFVESVLATLKRHQLSGENLELEVTERMLTHEGDTTASTAATLAALASAGISVAIDDFGTGYSSLSHLRTLPIDRLKIDQSFVRELGDSRDCFAITEAIIRLAASLGMRVIAEGVETIEQRTILRQMNVYATQGFLIARPMTGAGFERWLATATWAD